MAEYVLDGLCLGKQQCNLISQALHVRLLRQAELCSDLKLFIPACARLRSHRMQWLNGFMLVECHALQCLMKRSLPDNASNLREKLHVHEIPPQPQAGGPEGFCTR